jgi:erythromycin esterase-like protein
MVAQAARRESDPLVEALRKVAVPFEDGAKDLDPLVELAGGARFVLIGEASHGTHEFYKIRADLTKRLIKEKGFHAVAAEADWPDAWRVDRYARGVGDDKTADEALANFKRFPQWMWRNADVLDFVGWLRAYNDGRRVEGEGAAAGFYGMDLYSFRASMRAVLDFLDKADPEAAKRARFRYCCADHAGEDPESYGYAAAFNLRKSIEDGAVEQLTEMRRKAAEYAARDGAAGADEAFSAEQNARVVRNAEQYYREMFKGRVNTWNLRDTHMFETLEVLAGHLDKKVGQAKIVVWAHNSHIGDARATEVGEGGELNVGQLVREKHGDDAVNIGFSTYTGTVTAADDWDAPAERMKVNPGMEGSYEKAFHEVGHPRFLLNLHAVAAGSGGAAKELLREERLERAIGVIYRPQTERVSHYFRARLLEQFDAMIHIDETRAVEPLERAARAELREVPETFPTGV